MKRILSLLPSATEIICALGFQGEMVGRSHECDFPEGVSRLPVLTRPSFEPEGSSLEIDQGVRALVEKGLSLYRVDTGLLKELGPDIIVTQNQCEVCAVSEGELLQALENWVGAKAQIVSLKPDSLEDIWEDFRRVASALGAPDRAEALIKEIQSQMKESRKNIPVSKSPPRIACIEWLDPVMAAGNWMPTLIEMAGAENLFGEAGQHSPYIKWEELRKANPDIILLMPCGFDIPRTLSEGHVLQKLKGWEEMAAVQGGRVYVTDGNQYFNRPGPRLLDSFKIILEILYPQSFKPEYLPKGWIPFNAEPLGQN